MTFMTSVNLVKVRAICMSPRRRARFRREPPHDPSQRPSRLLGSLAMKQTSFRSRRCRPGVFVAVAVATVGLGAPSVAEAHFKLTTPPALSSQNFLGDPQKLPPCGDEPGARGTGAVTGYRAGETIEITVDETIFHPGHYRVALALNDRSELPPEPLVTAGSTACGSVPIDPNPRFPVLADGLFVHTSSLRGPKTMRVTLPSDVTCTKCTLQVLEFMSNHGLNNPGSCFYHHCATIAIRSASSVDGGSSDDDASVRVDGVGEQDGVGFTSGGEPRKGGAAEPTATGAANEPDARNAPLDDGHSGCSLSIPKSGVAFSLSALPGVLFALTAAWRRRGRSS